MEWIKSKWDYIQSLLDIDGDVWLGLMTALICLRIIGVPLWKWPELGAYEAGVYATAVTAFAYSNTRK